MTRDGCFDGYGDGGFGRTVRRVMMTQADRRDRLPIPRGAPAPAPATPIRPAPATPEAGTIVIVLTEAERTLIA